MKKYTAEIYGNKFNSIPLKGENLKFFNKYYPAVTGLLLFIIYLITLAPSVVEIDSGELAAVQATAGIAHPTGYPLFTMLGYLFLNLPLGLSKILMANLLAAVWCSLGIFVFSSAGKLILENTDRFQIRKAVKAEKKNKKGKTAAASAAEHPVHSSEEKAFTVFFAGLALGLSRTFWKQSTSVEVYSLHIFLMMLTIFFLLKAYIKRTDAGQSDIREWIMFAAALALAFSNHLTSILIIPGAAYLFFEKNRFGKESIRKILIMLLCFFPVLILIYSYLPLRASANPAINWGNPVDMDRLLRHVSGKQYQVWLFESMDSARKQLAYFVSNFPSEFAITGILFIGAGIISMVMNARRLLIFTAVTFIFTVLYSINYDIVDIDSYFLLAYIACGFFALAGIQKIFTMIRSGSRISLAGAALVTVFIISQFYLNFREVNQSGIRTYEDYTKAILQSAGRNSVILSYQWDYFISASYYYQQVEGIRKDVAVIDKELLRRSWYFNQLNNNYPDVVKKLDKYTAPFLLALKPFEESRNFDPELLERGYRDIMTHLVTDNLPERSVYLAPELVEGEMSRGEFALPEGFFIVPDLLLFRVVKTEDYVPAPEPDFIFRVPETRNKYITNIQNFAGSMLVRRALYELKFSKSDKARKIINKVKAEMPDYQIPLDLIKVFN